MRRGWWALRRRLVCGGILVGLMAAALAVAAEMPGHVAEQEGLKLKVDHKYIPKPEELKYVFATAAPVLHLKPGDVVSYRTPGGGGYGSPRERDPKLVLADVLDGKVSVTRAREVYGVVVDVERGCVDSKGERGP